MGRWEGERTSLLPKSSPVRMVPETWEKETVVAVCFGGAVHQDLTQCLMSQGRRDCEAQARVSQNRGTLRPRPRPVLYRPTFLHTHGHTLPPTTAMEAGGHRHHGVSVLSAAPPHDGKTH